MARKVAFIGTGGTIASIGKGPLDLIDYGANNTMVHAEDIVTAVPSVREVADLVVVKFRDIPSTAISFPEWKQLAALCHRLVGEIPGLGGARGTRRTQRRNSGGARGDKDLDLPSADLPDAGLRRARQRRRRARALLPPHRTAQRAGHRIRYRAAGLLAARGHLLFLRRSRRHGDPRLHLGGREGNRPGRLRSGHGHARRARGDQGRGRGRRYGRGVDARRKRRRARQCQAAPDGRAERTDNLNPQKARLLLALALTVTREPDEIRRIFATY